MIDQASSPTFFHAESLSLINNSGLDLMENDIRLRIWKSLRNMITALDEFTEDIIYH